jgi:REP element-mobilizing transposase RayT
MGSVEIFFWIYFFHSKCVNYEQKNFTEEHFSARGYTVSTVGLELEAVKKYIREQEATDE